MKSSLPETILNLRSFKREEKQYMDMAEEIISFVGLDGKENIKAKNLPYGQQRLLEIGRALATKPELILLDEPVAGMNDQESDEVSLLVKKLQQKHITVLLIEHHMRFVMNLCEKLTVFNSGAVIAEGPPKEIQNNKEVIEVYLGKKGRKDAKH
jgi:ABC-type branched-subunit amino acid transport system ATPase component